MRASRGSIFHCGESDSQRQVASYGHSKGVKPVFEYLMIWMLLRTGHRAMMAFDYGMIAALIVGVIVPALALALAGTDLAATFNAPIAEV